MLSCARKYKAIALSILTAATLVITSMTPCFADDQVIVGTPIDLKYDRNNTYENYLTKYKSAASPKQEVKLEGSKFGASSSQDFKIVNDYMERKNVLLWPSSVSWAQWNFDVPADGLYNICIAYNPGTEAKNDVELGLKINDTLPFNEADNNVLSRIWVNANKITQDDNGNDLLPKLQMTGKWIDYDLRDNEGLNGGMFKFYFKKGQNSIKLTSNGEPFYLDSIKIYQSPEEKSYKEVSQEYKNKGYKVADAEPIKIQAEDAGVRSSSVLNVGYDKSSPATEPNDVSKVKLNTISATYWRKSGQWITWTLDVKESGLYNIGLKYRQNVNAGLFSTRKILVDGKVPFKELENVKFGYDTNWNIKVLGDKNPYEFYLEKGKHEITMEATIGDMSDLLRGLQNDLYDLNSLYRQIIMISGSTIDTQRDYQFEKAIPNLVSDFDKLGKDLEKKHNELVDITGKNAGDSAFLLEFATQLKEMAKDPSTVATRLDQYKAKLGSLSNMILKDTDQPLEMDYIVVSPENKKMPSAKAGLFKSLSYSVRTFFASFGSNYSVMSNNKNQNKRTVKVWVGLGRDQAQVLKNLITDSFTPKTGINIDLELVQGSLIEATLAGRGPDIALQVAQDQPLNYALRGALVDLKQFSDFNGVKNEFYPSAFEAFEFQNKCYALPDTQTYDMLFYRKDVLSELHLGVPNTWDDFDKMIPILQEKKMDVGISQGLFDTLLFQKSGSYYKSSMKETAFDEAPAKDAFKQLTDYYVRYNFPLTYEAQNRFRTGEIPLMIQPYTLYNQLSVAAPEISGLWGMAPIPGTVDANGKINRSLSSTVTGCVMFQKTKDKDAAWEFMKWFTSSDTQAKYGNQLESIMGPSARYATANKEAFTQLPWTKDEQSILTAQWKETRGIPQTPGSYYVSRDIANAFRDVTISYKNPYESLDTWNKDINLEISRKFKEFNLK